MAFGGSLHDSVTAGSLGVSIVPMHTRHEVPGSNLGPDVAVVERPPHVKGTLILLGPTGFARGLVEGVVDLVDLVFARIDYLPL